ncbi:MAG: hypothetical protein GY798_06910 [Hyphomicrobiales bacterium]|nr:hypothetical protein [Hyphomicrobiales bacterium]
MATEAVAGAGRFRLDPTTLPVRSNAGSGIPAFTLDRHVALVRQSVAGIPATLSVPVDTYRGVSVRMESIGEAGDLAVFIELLHEDPRLTLPLMHADEPQDAAADWVAWARALNLPLLVVDCDGTVRAPVDRTAEAAIGGALQRRNHSLLRGRRSRYLRRRKPGQAGAQTRVHGREIIARD